MGGEVFVRYMRTLIKKLRSVLSDKSFKNLVYRSSEHFYYVGATLIAAMVHFLYSVYVKAHVEPLDFGIYSTCLLLKTYFSYVQLGSLNAFNRDYPQIVGAGDKQKAKQYRDTTFSYLLTVFVFSTLIISIVVMIGGNYIGADHRYTYGLVFCALLTGLTCFENFLSSRVRIDGSFKYTSIVIITELIATAIGFIIIPWIGYYALYIVAIGNLLIGIAMYYKRGISDLTLKIDGPLLKIIIFSGIPLLINNLIWTVVDSIDKFVILGFMDAERLGVYSIAQMAFSYMILIPSAMSQLFYVNLGKIYGATNSVDELNKAATRYTLIIASVISFFVLVAYYFMGPMVRLIMPRYSDGIVSAQILMLALAIYTPTMVTGNILTILKKNAALLRGSIYLCILNALCSIGFVLVLGTKLESVALGTAMSYLLRTLILIIQLKREAGTNVRDMIKTSIIPVFLIASPGIIIYHIGLNIWVGFFIAMTIAVTVFLLAYRKSVVEILKK